MMGFELAIKQETSRIKILREELTIIVQFLKLTLETL